MLYKVRKLWFYKYEKRERSSKNKILRKGRTLRLLKGGSGEEKIKSSKDFYTQKELVEVC